MSTIVCLFVYFAINAVAIAVAEYPHRPSHYQSCDAISSVVRSKAAARLVHQFIPQHGCIPAEPASVSPGEVIVMCV